MSLLEKYPNPKLVLTGANDEQFKEFNLNRSPYEVFTLKHDPEKTDSKYFEILLNKYNLKPSEVVYFEHNKEAAEVATQAGIKTMFYDCSKRDLKELKEFLDSGANYVFSKPIKIDQLDILLKYIEINGAGIGKDSKILFDGTEIKTYLPKLYKNE